MNDRMYEFHLVDYSRQGAIDYRMTRAEFEEVRRSKPTLYARLFAADQDAWFMRREVEG